MIRDEATENQLRAADPGASTWLSANAGSGKTRVLTDRVARLLLRGTDPQNILCLTYTKAAAAEMQNRLFKRLGEWAMLPDDALRAALADLGEDLPRGRRGLAQARILFAQAMEVPGGLRIQTIHAFCAGLLRRFPLEAGVNPQFTEMEDRSAALLRGEIVDRMVEGPDSGVVETFLAHVGGDDIDPMLVEIAGRADLFSAPFDADGLAAALDLPAGANMPALIANLLGDGERDLLRRLVPIMAAGTVTDQVNADKLRGITGRAADLAVLEKMFLWGADAKKNTPFSAKLGAVPTKGTRAKAPDLCDDLDDLMTRVEAARPTRLALLTLERSRALHAFARAFLARYEAAKSRRGLLDFDDLIRRAQRLLDSREVAQWVLFKLDGGIDHILVDEAQDTSPAQWAVIRGLAQEFAAGEGARADVDRTIFVVGDRKQSIYSFQGADPDKFDEMRQHFATELGHVDKVLARGTLDFSFRSSSAILRAVDEVFQGEHLQGLGPEPSQHRAFKAGMPGRVDLWPVVPKAEKEDEEGHWADPVDRIGARHHARILAAQVGSAVRDMIETGSIPAEIGRTGQFGHRPVTAGDILILVQRRSDLFSAIIRELKVQEVKVAGADRLRVGAELAVKDIGALLRFLALAEDDLSLAEALRSPLFGWTEQDLFTLAARRTGTLWQALRHGDRADTLAVLDDLRRQSDYLRPYDLINRLLVRHDGRRRLLSRLGPEAEDGIDALLSQALAYEQGNVPGLTGFVEWMQTDETDLKRQMESRGDAVRVMTVHGSKGLEAPIVILPDCAKRLPRDRDLILDTAGLALWPAPAADATDLQSAIRDHGRTKDEEERRRLLYVAMTRAESWLIVAAAGEAGEGGESWHGMVAEGLERAGAIAADMPGGAGLRLESGVWGAGPEIGEPIQSAGIEPVAAQFPPVLDNGPQVVAGVSPSDLGGAKVLPGETDPDSADAALARGRLLHLLLERLPGMAGDPMANAESLIAADRDHALVPDAQTVRSDALRMIADPAIIPLFSPESLAEVAITGLLPDGRRISGQIDRLLIGPDHVTVIDYKSNRLVPDAPDRVPEGILRQMGAYAHTLAAIYPGRDIRSVILWTATGRLMPLPHDLIMAALHRACAP